MQIRDEYTFLNPNFIHAHYRPRPIWRVSLVLFPPVGFFNPLRFPKKSNPATLQRYREAELTHGRVSMLAVIGFFVGEKVEGSSFLFDASIKGPAITHLSQVPTLLWLILLISIAGLEQTRAEKAFVEPENVPVSKVELMWEEYILGDLGFDPIGLKPADVEEFTIMQTKELQHGRLAMLAAVGFIAQELVDRKGIVEHFSS